MRKLLSVAIFLFVVISLADTRPQAPCLETLKALDLKYLGTVVKPNTNGSPTFNIVYHAPTWPKDETGKEKVGTFATPMCMAVQIAKSKTEWLWLTAAHCLTEDAIVLKSGKTKSEGFIYNTELGWREAQFEVHPARLDALKSKSGMYDAALIRIKGDTEKDGLAMKTVPLSNRWIQAKDKVTVTSKWNPGLHIGTVHASYALHYDETIPPKDPQNPRLSEETRFVDFEIVEKVFPGIKEGDSGSALLVNGEIVGVLSRRNSGEGYAKRGDYTVNEAMDWVRDEWSAFTGEKKLLVVESTKKRPQHLTIDVLIDRGRLPKEARGIKGEIIRDQVLEPSPAKWTAFKVTSVAPGSDASRMGLKEGDLILSVDTAIHETESKLLAALLEPSARKILIYSVDKKVFTELEFK